MTDQSIVETKNWKRPFFAIWSGQAISLLGSQLVQFALIWYITDETGSATALAGATMVALLPGVVLSPFIGALVDRWNRKQIMLVADAVIAIATLIMAVLFVTSIIQLWHIYALLFILSVGGNFHMSVMMLSVPAVMNIEQDRQGSGDLDYCNCELNIDQQIESMQTFNLY